MSTLTPEEEQRFREMWAREPFNLKAMVMAGFFMAFGPAVTAILFLLICVGTVCAVSRLISWTHIP